MRNFRRSVLEIVRAVVSSRPKGASGDLRRHSSKQLRPVTNLEKAYSNGATHLGCVARSLIALREMRRSTLRL